MSEGQKKGLFRACSSCSKKRLHIDDKHDRCLYCLYPHHQAKECKICRTFSNKTLKDREGRLLLWLNRLKTKTADLASEGESGSGASQFSLKRPRVSSPSPTDTPPMKTSKKSSEGKPSVSVKDLPVSRKVPLVLATTTASTVLSAQKTVSTSTTTVSTTTASSASSSTTRMTPSSSRPTSSTIPVTPSTTTPTTSSTTRASSKSSTTTTPSTKSAPSTKQISSTKIIPSTMGKPSTSAPSTLGTLPSTKLLSMKAPSSQPPSTTTKFSSTKIPTKAPSTPALPSTGPWKESALLSHAMDAFPPQVSHVMVKITKRPITPSQTSPGRIQQLPPACILQGQESDEDSFTQATSPSDLVLKCQTTDEEPEEEEDLPEQQVHPPPQSQVTPMVCLPASIVSDLQYLIKDYKERFPEKHSAPTLPAQAPTPSSRHRPTPLVIPQTQVPIQNVSSSEEKEREQEEGEVDEDQSDPDADQDYVAHSPASPAPQTSESPPADIGGFHNIMERAAKRFHMSMESQETECFLYDFKEPTKKTSRSIPIIEYIWKQGKQIMQSPASVQVVVPRLDKKYKATSTAPVCLTGHPKPDSVVTQAAQKNSRNPASPLSTPPDKEVRNWMPWANGLRPHQL
ncbi:uncharacterized protein LOC144826958 [Lissotriton helveticus]